MALRTGLFDSTEIVQSQNGYPQGNKAQTADFFAKYFSMFIGNGVYFSPSTNFEVMSYTGMSVQMRPGSAFINGYFCFDDDTWAYSFPTDSSDHVYWFILRLDTADGSISRLCITDPYEGSLPLRSSTVHDLVLAKVSVPANATAVSDAMIDDCRADPALCGFVKSLIDAIGSTVPFAESAGSLAATLSVSSGGTGATTPSEAVNNLGISYGVQELTPGESPLETGSLYFVYEE